MVKLHKSGEIKFLHKNLWGILLICTKKPQENQEGFGRTLKKLDNSSRCARMRQQKVGNEVEKKVRTSGIMVKVPVSTEKCAISCLNRKESTLSIVEFCLFCPF